jgi:hypothetical protein
MEKGHYSESLAERLVRLEEQVSSIKMSQDEENETVKGIEEKLDQMLLDSAKYKGYIGGALFIISCVFTFLKAIPLIGSLFTAGK